MTHTSQPASWPVRLRALTRISLVFLATSCSEVDRLGPLDPAGLPLSADEVRIGKGIPFGPFNLPREMFGPVYSGSVKATGPEDILKTLASARSAGARVLVRLSSSNPKWQNKDKSVNLEKWKSQVARFKNVNLQPYIDDGTLLGHYLIDEPHDATNWGGKPVPFATLEAMAQYSKQLWPDLTTVVRSYATWLAQASFQWKYLDATLAQYSARKGEINGWMDTEARYARQEGLGLLFSMNVLNGGNKASGLKGLSKGNYAMNASQLRSWGSLLANHPQTCAFFAWAYNTSYLGRSDIKSAIASLSDQTKSRNRVSCKGAGSGETPSGGGDTGGGGGGTPDDGGGGTPGGGGGGTPDPGTGGGGGANPGDNGGSDIPGETPGSSSSIVLTVRGATHAQRHYMSLRWTGASGPRVDVHIAGAETITTANDGHFTTTRTDRGPATYTYKVCEKGSSTCSASVSVAFE